MEMPEAITKKVEDILDGINFETDTDFCILKQRLELSYLAYEDILYKLSKVSPPQCQTAPPA